MSTTHTPGPWTHKATASLGPQYAVYPENSGADICIVYDHDNTEANARLIAAAPELKSSLDEITEWIETTFSSAEKENWPMLDRARAAIAKAHNEK